MKDIRLLPSLERWPRLYVPQMRAKYAFSHLLERRWWLFLGLDALFVLSGYASSAVNGARIEHVFRSSVLIPALLLAIPALSGLVALERRAGSLDLALSVPSTERYFLRRALPVLAVLAAQSVFLLIVAWLENAGGFNLEKTKMLAILGRSLVQTFCVLAFLGAVSLFWSVRLRSAGAVTVATVLTVLVFWKWLSTSPAIAPPVGPTEKLLGLPLPILVWTASVLVIAAAAAIFYLYARERLRRPETMLA